MSPTIGASVPIHNSPPRHINASGTLNIVPRQVKTGDHRRRRGGEFHDFMNQIVKARPGQGMHLVLDHLNTHKAKAGNVFGVANEPSLSLYADPRKLAQSGEGLGSYLDNQRNSKRQFNIAETGQEAINKFVAVYHSRSHRFLWTKEVIYQRISISYYTY